MRNAPILRSPHAVSLISSSLQLHSRLIPRAASISLPGNTVTKKTLRKKTSTPPPSVSFAIAGGKIWVDPRDGCPIRAQAPVGGPAEFLLDEKYPFFQAPHRWGKGFV